MRVSIFVVIFLLHILQSNGQPEPVPVHVPVKVLRGSAAGTCPSEQDTIDAKDELRQNLADLPTYSCGGSGGWRRVGYLDMTDPSQSCPSGLALKTYSPGSRTCGRATDTPGCSSTFYNTGGSQYSRVCGRVRGYQFGATGAFRATAYRGAGFDSNYVDGVSLTHRQSGSRTHIWTFAAGLAGIYNGRDLDHYCRCVNAAAPSSPSFVGNDYFCESAHHSSWVRFHHVFYPDNPLWDGQNCTSSCCQFNNPPYFTKTLPAPTDDNIELRICTRLSGRDVDVPIDQVELYVE